MPEPPTAADDLEVYDPNELTADEEQGGIGSPRYDLDAALAIARTRHATRIERMLKTVRSRESRDAEEQDN